MNKTPQTLEKENKQKGNEDFTKVVSRNKNNGKEAIYQKNLSKEESQDELDVLNSTQETMDHNQLIVDEAGEEDMNLVDNEHDVRDTGNTNRRKEQEQEDIEIQRVEIEETPVENKIEEAM